MKFTDYEQSLLWQCMNDKRGDRFHTDLSELIWQHLSNAPDELFRGLSKTETRKSQGWQVGDIIEFGRVTSFSEDICIASSFCNSWSYNTYTMLQLIKCDEAFNYSDKMIDIIYDTPLDEFVESYHNEESDLKRRKEEKIEMVEGELEWMIPSDKQFVVTDIQEFVDDRSWPSGSKPFHAKTIITIEPYRNFK